MRILLILFAGLSLGWAPGFSENEKLPKEELYSFYKEVVAQKGSEAGQKFLTSYVRRTRDLRGIYLLGFLQYQKGEYEQAEMIGRFLLADKSDQRMFGSANWLLARIYTRWPKSQVDPKPFYQAAVKIFDALGDRKSLFRIEVSFADYWLEIENVYQASIHLTAALNELVNFDGEVDLIAYHQVNARYHSLKENFEQSLNHLSKERDLISRDQKYRLADNQFRKAQVNIKMHHFEDAIKDLGAAKDIFKASKDETRYNICVALEHLVMNCMQQISARRANEVILDSRSKLPYPLQDGFDMLLDSLKPCE